MWHGPLVAAILPVSFNGVGIQIPIGPLPVMPAWYFSVAVIPGTIAVVAISYIPIERPFLHPPLSHRAMDPETEGLTQHPIGGLGPDWGQGTIDMTQGYCEKE
jgi:hypothetical protein